MRKKVARNGPLDIDAGFDGLQMANRPSYDCEGGDNRFPRQAMRYWTLLVSGMALARIIHGSIQECMATTFTRLRVGLV